MSRPKRLRKMMEPPKFKGFRPFGYYGTDGEPVLLHLEEFEAIRLIDHENLSQEEASTVMEVSRPTVTRIYDRARKKVAKAFAEARTLTIEGGTVFFDDKWYSCISCHSTFNSLQQKADLVLCPVCGGNEIESTSEAFGNI